MTKAAVDKVILTKIANTIRGLSLDAIQKANSGHPGLPLGCAELGAVLWSSILKYNPKNPSWINRDYFVLSAGHGSAWLYSCLHLSGYDISIEDLKNFRQIHSKTPGHPEFGVTSGVEATTGPLGQGLANAVGIALTQQILRSKFNKADTSIFDGKVYCLCGDGDLMEGVSHEACSLAGNLKLSNLVVIYDSNDISLDGKLEESCSDDAQKRFESYGWFVEVINGNDIDQIQDCFSKINSTIIDKPIMIIAKTIIGKGAADKEGSHKIHGAPIGAEAVAKTKINLNLPAEEFVVSEEVKAFFDNKIIEGVSSESKWNELFTAWKNANPNESLELSKMMDEIDFQDLENTLKQISISPNLAGRSSSQVILRALVNKFNNIYGGSADLSCSDLTYVADFSDIKAADFSGRNIKYGVREFAMAAVANGMAYTGMIKPFIGTFLTFSDYCKPAIRLAALSKIKVLYQFTHDSIFVGEDGPTHEPIEQIASLRALPGLYVFRPADANEVKMSWLGALKVQGPAMLALSRQALPDLEKTNVSFKDGVGRGAYVVFGNLEPSTDYSLYSSGSEVSLAIEVAKLLENQGKTVKVISMPCFEIFEEQSQEYKTAILKNDKGLKVAIEAAASFGWHKYVGEKGLCICVESFGESGNPKDIAKQYGFTAQQITEKILNN